MNRIPLSRRNFLQAGAGAAAGLAGISRAAETNPGAPGSYTSGWESLDAHPCPAWYRDAKIGLYFHWGLSSVPGWAPREGGTPYAEWYWNSMRDPNNPTWRYHRETYGEKFGYDDFIPRFRAGRYRPGEWVDLAKRSGAKYLFVNAKHHDGFCLWPTRYTRRNARDLGPRRDLIGPLADAARDAGLKFGFYYSFYEWYNPLYTGQDADYTGLVSVRNYVDDFMAPQVRELIDRYHPDFLYFDGEWDRVADFWKSRDLVA
jgi:alpha-L-fucosidase